MNAFVSGCRRSFAYTGAKAASSAASSALGGLGEASARLAGVVEGLGILVRERGGSGAPRLGPPPPSTPRCSAVRCFETRGIGEQNVHLRPEMHVGGHVGSARRPRGVGCRCQRLELESLDRAVVEPLPRAPAEDLRRRGPRALGSLRPGRPTSRCRRLIPSSPPGRGSVRRRRSACASPSARTPSPATPELVEPRPSSRSVIPLSITASSSA